MKYIFVRYTLHFSIVLHIIKLESDKMNIVRIRHDWPEDAGFKLDRPNGCAEYVFLHFINPIELLYCGEQIVTLPNACIIFSHNHPQRFYAHQKFAHNWMHITGDVEEIMALYDIQPNTLYYVLDGDFITSIVAQLEIEFFKQKEYGYDLSIMKLHELFIKLSREIGVSESKSHITTLTQQRFRQLRKEIMLNLRKKWTTSEMAEKVFLSNSQFHLKYKNIFGISPKQDIILARIEKAKRLLSLKKYTNNQIAKLIGYSSEYFFIRQFKEFTGKTPQKYCE